MNEAAFQIKDSSYTRANDTKYRAYLNINSMISGEGPDIASNNLGSTEKEKLV